MKIKALETLQSTWKTELLFLSFGVLTSFISLKSNSKDNNKEITSFIPAWGEKPTAPLRLSISHLHAARDRVGQEAHAFPELEENTAAGPRAGCQGGPDKQGPHRQESHAQVSVHHSPRKTLNKTVLPLKLDHFSVPKLRPETALDTEGPAPNPAPGCGHPKPLVSSPSLQREDHQLPHRWLWGVQPWEEGRQGTRNIPGFLDVLRRHSNQPQPSLFHQASPMGSQPRKLLPWWAQAQANSAEQPKNRNHPFPGHWVTPPLGHHCGSEA